MMKQHSTTAYSEDTIRQIAALSSMTGNGILENEETASLVDQMLKKEIRKAVTEKIKPYLRNKDKEIVYYCASRKGYKIYIPAELRRKEEAAPQSAKTADELWKKAYEYLYGLSAKPTVNDYYQKWREARLHDIDIANYSVYCDDYRYKKYIIGHGIAKKQIDHVTPADVKKFLKEITAGRQITRKEMRSVKSILNSIFSLAMDMGAIEFNPAIQVKTNDLKCKAVNNRSKVYTEEERRKLLEYLDALPVQTAYTLAIALMFCLDIRIGELKALRWSDYDRSKKTIYIHNEIVTRFDENGVRKQVELTHTKAGEGGDRVQRLSPRALQILEKAQELNPDHGDEDYILPANCEQKTPIYTNRFNQRLRQLCTRAGINYYSSHKMRFYAVAAQARAGVDIDTIRYNSGHLHLETTLGYIRRAKNEAENSEKWDEIFD